MPSSTTRTSLIKLWLNLVALEQILAALSSLQAPLRQTTSSRRLLVLIRTLLSPVSRSTLELRLPTLTMDLHSKVLGVEVHHGRIRLTTRIGTGSLHRVCRSHMHGRRLLVLPIQSIRLMAVPEEGEEVVVELRREHGPILTTRTSRKHLLHHSEDMDICTVMVEDKTHHRLEVILCHS